MFKKKRIVLLLALAGLVFILWRYGWQAAVFLFAAFIVLMFGVWVKNIVRSRKGLAGLQALQKQYGFPSLIEQARQRIGEGPEFTFAVYGDSRKKMKVARRIVSQIKEDDPAAIFHTGDIVRGGAPTEYLSSLLPLMDIAGAIPMLCVPGNHERGAMRNYAGFQALFGGVRFAFEAGECCFVGFNNNTHNGITKDDLAYVRDALSKTSARHKFVFMHIPPAFFEATFVSDGRRRGVKKGADDFHALMREFSVDEVFMAHIHGYASTEMDGVRYTLTAGGGASLTKRIAEDGRCHHYLLRHIGPEGVRRERVRMKGDGWARDEG